MNPRTLSAWALVILGLAMLVVGLLVGVQSWEVTFAVIVIGIVAIVVGAFLGVRARRTS